MCNSSTYSFVYQALIVSVLLLFAPVFLLRAQDANESTRVFTFHFRLNSGDFEPGFIDNSREADSLSAFLSGLSDDSILSADVVAFASPEGSSVRNHQLCVERADAFATLVATRFPRLKGKLFSIPGGEAWEDLRDRLNQDARLQTLSPEKYRQISDILDNTSISQDERKAALKSSLEDNWYGYLRWIHYRYLRRCEVRVHYLRDSSAPVSQNTGIATGASPDTVFVTRVDTVYIVRTDTVYVEKNPVTVQRPVLGISTNLPYDITYIPNYGVTSIPSFSLEYYPKRGHYTLGADLEIPMWRQPSQHRYMQIQNLTLWVRRYFKTDRERFKGAYLLANVNAARYGIGWDAKGWEGEGLGAGLGAGYKFTLGKRLFLDLGGSVGFFYSGYDPFVWGNDATGRYYYDYAGDPTQFTRRRKRLFWAGPTRVYISLGIDLFNRKK